VAKSIHDEELLSDEEASEGLTQAFSRKTLVVLAAVILVVAAIGVTILVFSVDEGAALSIDLTVPSRSGDTVTMAYTIHTERALASGTCTFTVLFNGAAVHTRTFKADSGGGGVTVHFREFVVGNGDYTFRLEYKGARGQTTYTIGSVSDRTDFIVNGLRQGLANIFVGDGHIGAIQYSAYFYSDAALTYQTAAPPDSYLLLQLKKNGYPDGAPYNLSTVDKVFLTRTLNVSLGPGNYSVDALFVNQWVKDDAPIKTLNASNTTFVQNTPYACMVGSPYHGNNANNFTVTADASCSHDDIGIIQYTWDFGDGTPPVTNGAIPTETHQFPSSVAVRTYTGTVSVYDAHTPDPTTTTFTVTTSAS
jgi:hypothetical protein